MRSTSTARPASAAGAPHTERVRAEPPATAKPSTPDAAPGAHVPRAPDAAPTPASATPQAAIPASPPAAGSPPAATDPQAIRIAAVHLEGIETLRAGARHIELRFSDVGLDVISTFDGEPVGRLTWEEITAIELPKPRRSLRRRRQGGAEIVVRTDRGQARFELPAVSDEQAREYLAPVLSRPRGTPSADST